MQPEHHQGMVAAIAFESLVKLLAFLAVGVFVTFGIYDGFGDLFARAAAQPKLKAMMAPLAGVAGGYANWVWLTILSMMAIMFLPRQFQVAVVENVDEKHLSKAIWLFPVYMLAINIFVLPIAFGGLLRFPDGSVDADTFVLTLPMAEKHELLALLVFIGGLSAATGMIIVETIALSTMVCNDLVMPVLLRLRSLRLNERPDLTGLLLGIRRGAIVLILLLGYLYFKLAGEAYALVAIGLISFAAVAQFAPAILGGIFWKGGTRAGAFCGLLAGFGVWLYTLLLPALARSGWLPISLLEEGPFGIALLKPLELFGLTGLDQISHAMIWSMIANLGAYVGVSLSASPSADEHRQASVFVDVFRHTGEARGARFWRGTASVPDLHSLLARFLGTSAADSAFAEYARARGLHWPDPKLVADAELVHYVEVQLAGAIGGASGANHGRLGRQRRNADDRRSARHPRRGLAGRRLQSPTRAEIARARSRDGRAPRGQRAVEGARPVEGRLRVHGDARAPHAAHVDPCVHRDPARRPRGRARTAEEVPRHHHQGDRAPDATHQPGPRPREDRVGQGRVERDRGRRARCHFRHPRRDGPGVQREEHRGDRSPAREGLAGDRRSRPDDPGDAEPAVERREVLRCGRTAGSKSR
jgi:Na+/proline symporter